MNGFNALLSLAQADLSAFSGLGRELPDNAWIVGAGYVVLVAIGLALDLALLVRLAVRPVRWPQHVSRLQWRPWTRHEAGLLMLALLLLYFLASRIQPAVRALVGADGAGEKTIWIILQSLFFHLAGLGLVFHSLAHRRLPWKSAFGFDAHRVLRDIGTGVVFYVATMPFLVFYSLVYQAGLKYAGYDLMPQEVVMVFANESSIGLRIYLLVLAVAIAPLFEEVLFRGIGLPLFAKRWGVAPAVLLVSAIFAAIHFHLASFAPLFVIAVGFALGYILSESILVPIVMHSLFNAVNLGLLMALKQF